MEIQQYWSMTASQKKYIKLVEVAKARKGRKMNLEVVTIQDCIDMCDLKGYVTLINDGKVYGFKAEKVPTADRESE